MLTYIFLVSVFILVSSPFFLVGYIIQIKQEKKLQERRDEIARQSRK